MTWGYWSQFWKKILKSSSKPTKIITDKIEITNSTIKKDPKPKNRIKKNENQIWHKNKTK
jgi:transposase-like protein